MPTKVKKTSEEEAITIPEEIEKQLLSVEMLPVDSLIIDPAYQRDYDAGRVVKMANEWNWLGCGTIAVSLREEDGKNVYAVIDGQQRVGAIRLKGFKEAPCRIYVDLTQEQEALLYELLNRNKKLGFNDIFKSRLMRGEEVARNIDIAVRTAGYKLDPERRHAGQGAKDTHFYIQTMSELENTYKIGGSLLIIDTLKFIKSVWAPEYLLQQQGIIAGVARFLKTYPSAKLPELREKLQKQGLLKTIQNSTQWTAVHGSAAMSNRRGTAFCEAMLACYNHNRQEAHRIKSKAV